MNNKIILKKINHNNFHNISIEIEKNEFVVITGPSGSGKSTLAMDIIYAEGQRKFIESLPPYARQFIPLPEKPEIEDTIGLTPCIAIDQKSSSCNNRSIVGTISEVYDYVRILYTLIGTQHCITCKKTIKSWRANDIADDIIKNYNKKKILISCPIAAPEEKRTSAAMKLSQKIHTIKLLIQAGYTKFNINYNSDYIYLRSDNDINTLKLKNLDIVFVICYEQQNDHQKDILINAINKSIELLNDTSIMIYVNEKPIHYGLKNICTTCKNKVSYDEITQKAFSFNLPTGACQSCKGTGETSPSDIIFYALSSSKNGILEFAPHKNDIYCSSCKGNRLNESTLAITVNEKNIAEFCQIPLNEYTHYFEEIKQAYITKKDILHKIFYQIEKRINLLIDLGLGYLTLWRCSNTLSGGELQRIRLAGQLGSALAGVTYILDEPSIGLHQSDNIKLITTIKKLRDLGNTILVVEHDEETMLAADTIIDIGPGAGINGGKIVFHGKPKNILKDKHSITGKYLNNELNLNRTRPLKKGLSVFSIVDAKKNNLKNISVDIPIGGVLTVITGVSGSGKSTLIFDEFIPQCTDYLTDIKTKYKKVVVNDLKEARQIKASRDFNDLIVIDQQALTGSNRSTVGTYFGFFDEIRALFALLPESKMQNLDKGCFSFNIGKYRCHNCSGKGQLEIQMEPLPPTIIHCTECQGKRYSKAILAIKYKEKNIFEVLNMTIIEAAEFFFVHKKIHKALTALISVGLGYIKLNQGADTFSGGEAQRIKLAYELNRKGQNTIYVLDEPTTGLHFQDIALLLKIFDELLEKGNSLVIIEHNLSIIRYADHIIDIGPGGGKTGGYVIAEGTPAEIKKNKNSLTGKYI